jgi:hypothetical protein
MSSHGIALALGPHATRACVGAADTSGAISRRSATNISTSDRSPSGFSLGSTA